MEYNLNLDLPPKLRWVKIGKEFSQYGAQLERQVLDKSKQMLGNAAPKINFVFRSYHRFLTKINRNKLQVYWDEIKGLAKGLNVKVDILLYLNYGYDYSTKCTAAITKLDNKLIHLRTLDWDFEFLKNLKCIINFIKDGKIIYKSFHIIGLIGIITAMNSHYSVSINYRHSGETKLVNTTKSIVQSILCNYPVTIYLRHVLDQAMGYNTTVKMLLENRLLSPVYYVICGTKTACSIYRDRQGGKIHDIDFLNMLVQTNHDIDRPILENQFNNSLLRYQTMSNGLQNIDDINGLQNVINSYPIYNSHTIYSVIMIPKTDTFIW